MKKQRTSGTYTGKKEKVIFDLPIVTYEENGVQVIYSPSLDVFGYGKTYTEARKSFILTLEEFLRYTTHKKTLEKVLKNMGWVVKKKNNHFIAPSLGYMLDENEQFNEIFNQKEFRKSNEQIEVPLHV